MKPEEKAKQLVYNYLELVKGSLMYDTYLSKAKKCALIAVEEILDLGYSSKSDFEVYGFYSKVKIEINKL